MNIVVPVGRPDAVFPLLAFGPTKHATFVGLDFNGDEARVRVSVRRTWRLRLAIDFVLGALYGPKRCRADRILMPGVTSTLTGHNAHGAVYESTVGDRAVEFRPEH